MSTSEKLWRLTVPKREKPIALLDTWDRAQILAKRLGLSEFTVTPVFVTIDEIPMEEIHSDPPKKEPE